MSFSHRKYETGKWRQYAVRPLFLKQYLRRWYLVASLDGIPNYLFFGIDRIKDLHLSEVRFKPEKVPLDDVDSVVGLSRPTHQVEDVVLAFDAVNGEYVKSLPLHRSQEVLRESSRQVVIKLRVIPNYELVQRILMFGKGVSVLGPEKLVRSLEAIHRACLKNLPSKA